MQGQCGWSLFTGQWVEGQHPPAKAGSPRGPSTLAEASCPENLSFPQVILAPETHLVKGLSSGPLCTFPLPRAGGEVWEQKLAYVLDSPPPSASTCSHVFPGQRANSLEKTGVKEGIIALPCIPSPLSISSKSISPG